MRRSTLPAVRRAGVLLALTLFLAGDAVAAPAPTLAVSATGVLGISDTIVIAVTNLSSRVDVEIPPGYAFPGPKPQGGHAFITLGDGTGAGRAVLSPLASPPATDCPAGHTTKSGSTASLRLPSTCFFRDA